MFGCAKRALGLSFFFFFVVKMKRPSSKFVLSLICMRICCADQEGESLCLCGEMHGTR